MHFIAENLRHECMGERSWTRGGPFHSYHRDVGGHDRIDSLTYRRPERRQID